MLTLWTNGSDAVREMDDLHRRLDKLGKAARSGGTHWPDSTPSFRMKEEGEQLTVSGDIPGVRAEDIEIDATRAGLTIRARRKTLVPEGYVAHRCERSSYEFTRSFSLPCRVDLERTRAIVEHGTVRLELCKAAEERPRAIRVEVK